MSWNPRLLSVGESFFCIVLSGFLVAIPVCLYGYRLWSSIEGIRRNRQERIRRETGLESGNNR
jgi:hypothetical protein